MNTIALLTFWLLEGVVTFCVASAIRFACGRLSMTADEEALLQSGDDQEIRQWQKIVDQRIALANRWWIIFPLTFATAEVVSLAFHAFFPFLP